VSNATKGLERAGSGDGLGGYKCGNCSGIVYGHGGRGGFREAQSTDVAITVGGIVELPIALTVAAARKWWRSPRRRSWLKLRAVPLPTRSASGASINLPINGRNYINFTLTDSQVQRDNAPNLGAAPTSGLNMSGQSVARIW